MKRWKNIMMLTLVIVLTLSITSIAQGASLLFQENSVMYSIFINGQEAGVVHYPAKGLALYDEVMGNLYEKYGEDVELVADVVFKEKPKTKPTSDASIKDKIETLTDVLITGYGCYIDGKLAFYMEDQNEINNILEAVKEPYREEKAQNTVSEPEFKEQVTIEKETINIKDIEQVEHVKEKMTRSTEVGSMYIVQEGDSFWDIAERNTMSIDQLTTMNPDINPEKLSIGTELVVSINKAPLTVVTKKNLTTEQKISYDKETEKTSSLYKDQSKIKQKGKDGTLEVTLEVCYENGVEVGRKIVGEKVLVEPVTEIKQVGTKERPKPVIQPTAPAATGGLQKLHWNTVNGIWSRNFGTARITDVMTGKVFYLVRTGGTLHADAETPTTKDTSILKSIYGGGFSWNRRPVIVEVGGYKIGASMSGMPHAGLDSQPNRAWVSGRSGGYGTGTNYDGVKGNGMNGHIDVHFYGSKRHKDGRSDSQHQAAIASLFS